MTFVVGIDGGGTATRVALADLEGRELARHTGLAGLIDPADPRPGHQRLVALVREAADEAGLQLPAAAVCAGLAGVGTPAAAEATRAALAAARLAAPDRVAVVEDGEIALEGAHGGQPGLLLIAGTGSVAWGRAPDGRLARCGGWGRVVGDEGSAYAIAADALRRALHGEDGRGPGTALLPELLAATGGAGPRDIPPWAGRASKGEIAALAPIVARAAAAGDTVAAAILDDAARALAEHVHALLRRLGPWPAAAPLSLQGGALLEPALADRLRTRLDTLPLVIRPPAADAVTGALRKAAALTPSPPRTEGAQ